jgi:hypothetical protein
MANKPMKEYGLHHRFNGYFELQLEDATSDSFILPLIHADAGMSDPDNVQVNPYSANFEDSVNTSSTYYDSVVNRINLRLRISMPVAGQETGIQAVTYQSMPIMCSFDDLDKDVDGTNNVASFLELEYEDTNSNQVCPLWSGTDITGSDLNAGVPNLTTDQTPESVAFNAVNFEKELKISRAGGLLKELTMGGLRTHVLYKDRPFYQNRWFDVPSRVKRQNKNTFLGLLFHLPSATQFGTQFYLADETTDIDHLRIGYEVNYNEFNDYFDQQANA